MSNTEVGTSYEVLVEEGRRARQEADGYQWRQGDLALEVEALTAENKPRDESGAFVKDEKQLLKRYADDVDIPYETMKKYRQTAKAWPAGDRHPLVGWEAHRLLAAQEDRTDLIGEEGRTAAGARRLVAQRNTATHHPPGWMELIGQVGDDLIRAEKDLTKVEDAITRQPNQKFRAKAERYADWADVLARRLRAMADGG